MIRTAASAIRLVRRDRRQALRALGWLVLARAAIRVWPYWTIRRVMDRIAPGRLVAAPIAPAECERALRRALRVLPRSSCLAQAIAAACLLRRDGRDSTLSIGVRFDPAHHLDAHAWLESDGIIVTGRREPSEHRVLLRDAVDRRGFEIRHV
jgi:Transglutaminase-like superfamily